MRKIKILCKTDWVSLRKIIDPEQEISGYDYLHEDRCAGKIISVLPYRVVNDEVQYLLRKEITPCWSYEPVISSITGGLENDNIEETVVQEIAEEAGYEVTTDDLIYLITTYGTKSSDSKYYIYSVDLTGKEKTLKGDGDGSSLEKIATCYWSDTVDDALDPLVYVAYCKIQNHLQKSNEPEIEEGAEYGI